MVPAPMKQFLLCSQAAPLPLRITLFYLPARVRPDPPPPTMGQGWRIWTPRNARCQPHRCSSNLAPENQHGSPGANVTENCSNWHAALRQIRIYIHG